MINIIYKSIIDISDLLKNYNEIIGIILFLLLIKIILKFLGGIKNVWTNTKYDKFTTRIWIY